MGRKIESKEEVQSMSDRRLVEYARARVTPVGGGWNGYAMQSLQDVVEELATRLEETIELVGNLVGDMESGAVGECGKCGKYTDGYMTNDPDIIQAIDHTRECIMGDAPECNCPASSVRIIL